MLNAELLNYKKIILKNISDYINTKNFKEAFALINEYEEIFPSDMELLSSKSVALIMDGKFDAAEEVLHKALALNENYFDALYNLAYLYRLQGLKKKAFDYYQKSINLAPSEEMKVQISDLMINIVQTMVENKPEIIKKKPLVSIVVLAYNHLDYTRLCVESVYNYTKDIDFELITVNNGSTDGTKEYFDSLPNKKKIHLKDNVGPVNGFIVGMQAAEGKYTACICNDFIFSTNWLANIIKVIEDDQTIGYVSPGSSSISNGQQINGEYTNIEEMQEFAARYNVSDSSKWEERVRLLPNVLLVRTHLFAEVGYYDSRFYFGEFADDDFAFRVRRAGYKLIYAGDTFVYHFGSVTTGSEHVEKNSLQVSRKIFVDKYGIDAWEDASFCPYITDVVDYSKKQENVRILGINTACGATSLQVKNKYAQRGTKVYLANYLEDAKYLVDSKTVSDTSLVGRLEDIAISLNETFDTIIVERGLESCRDLIKFLHSLCLLTEKGGQIYLALSNEFYYSNIIHGLNRKSTDNSDKLIQYYIDLNKLIGVLQSLGLTNIRTIRCINIMDEKQKDIIRSLSSTMPDAQLAEEILSAHKYVVCAQI